MMRVVAIIPARYASLRLPAKPLVDIGGKPMVQHVYERATEAASVDDVLVATDDERIANAVLAFGGKAVMTSVALQSGTDRVAFVAQDLADADIIVNVQGDEPLLEPQMIDKAVAVVSSGSEVMVGTLVKQIENDSDLANPNVVKAVLDNDGNCLYFSRSPIPYARDIRRDEWMKHHVFYKHIGLYVYRKEFLLHYTTLEHGRLERAEKLEQLRILEHGFRIKAAITAHDSRPVDTWEDLEYVRHQVKRTNG